MQRLRWEFFQAARKIPDGVVNVQIEARIEMRMVAKMKEFENPDRIRAALLSDSVILEGKAGGVIELRGI